MRMTSLALGLPRARPAVRPFAALSRLIRLRRERRALLALDAHLLRDVGLSREQALDEAARPLWDAPVTWRQ